ncbi:hypothetical protein JTE90_028248 [Oedothorax gibbosus]|uniref:Uncharacterized protein n=1 Tax=Oedothorax gibbosus TaxID=931172 RepID=A0AAV6UR65_9ARAC|nr:hypothetical protein JTE90_028248 [Oedothorax gibbosus]
MGYPIMGELKAISCLAQVSINLNTAFVEQRKNSSEQQVSFDAKGYRSRNKKAARKEMSRISRGSRSRPRVIAESKCLGHRKLQNGMHLLLAQSELETRD